MANENLGASFSIDTTNLKAGLAQANRLIRESESEFKAAAAGMDDWAASEDGLNAKIKSLNDVTEIQRKKVDALQGEYDRLIENGLDPTSKEAVELRTKINKETEALNKNEKELEQQTKALEELANSTEDAADATDEASGGFEKLKAAGGVAVGAVAAVGAACVGAVAAFLGLAEGTRESRNEMAKLDTAFQTAGLSAQNAESTFTELYSIMGDEGAATEAAQQLAKFSKNEEDLAANTRILTGVMAEYGTTIPTEGLAEGMAATAAMGEVQGVLADALEWQGVNLDEYNAKLATLSTEEERAAYIQSTLTDLYGASADAYRENNAAVIEAQEAQANLNIAMNELGAIAEPIMTRLKNIAADLLTTITPFISLIGEGLTGALVGVDGAAETLADGINGIITSLLSKIIEILPIIIDAVVSVIPKLISSILEKLPDILQLVLDVIMQVINALGQVLPQIITKVVELIPELINKILQALPQLIQAVISLVMGIVKALPKIIVSLINALPSIIENIINALLAAIPMLIEAGIQLFMAIVQAIPVIIDALIKNLPTIINTIIDGLLDAIPMLLQGAIQLLMAIISAIPTIISVLVKDIPKIVTTIINALLSRLPDLIQGAVKLLMGIIQAIPTIIKELVKQTPTIIKTIVAGLKDGLESIKSVGKNLVSGLWEGIKNSFAWIKSKIKGWVGDVMKFIKKLFGINSPSKVMADEVGKNLALGIGKGFTDNIGAVNDDIASAMNFENANVNVSRNGSGGVGVGGVTINQYNTYAQAHSRYELYKTKQQTAAAVRLAMAH